MQIQIRPITIETESSTVTCSVANVSLAATDSVAIRLVPVDAQGNEYPENAIGVVGVLGDAGTDVLLDAIQTAVKTFLSSRGV